MQTRVNILQLFSHQCYTTAPQTLITAAHDMTGGITHHTECTTTHGPIDEGVLWFELTDGSAEISTAISKHHIG
jgi:hypothetical protein